LQEVAFEILVFEERTRCDGKLWLDLGSFSHYDQESDNDSQEKEGRSRVTSASHV
jgi:hypothetical protein